MTTKFYNNPQRAIAEAQNMSYQQYVPQYKQRGIEPEDFASLGSNKFNTNNKAVIIKGTPNLNNNQATFRSAPISKNVPFAEAVSTTETMNLPNVGNNIETNWSALDGDIIDDLGIFSEQESKHMIDNNEYIEEASTTTSDASVHLQDDEYLLAIEESIITTGNLEFIEQEVSKLVFGEHELCAGKQIPIDNIIVLKRVKLKVGVFIDG